MSSRKQSQLVISAWILGAIVSGLSVIAWGSYHSWDFSPFSSYTLFPLLGLLAFGLMWTHYVLGTVRELVRAKEEILKSYFHLTGYAVLVLICLHPGILIYQLFRDGAGLPPFSYESYVAPGLGWITLLGSVSLLVFLAFELHRFFDKKPWWHWVVDASDFAMLAIVYHGLRLGTDLRQPWFRAVWWFYALTLLIIIVRKYYLRLTIDTKKASPVN